MQQLQLFTGLILASIVIGSLIVFFTWALTRGQQRRKQALEQLYMLAEVTAREKEKARITNKLHEDFGPTLSAIKLYVGNLTPDDKSEQEYQHVAKLHINSLITKIRTMTLELAPYALQQRKLDNALQQYINAINDEHQNLIYFQADGFFHEISDYKAVSIYRIVQEIVTNTLKHANATELIIELKQSSNGLLLITKDNGVGFDYRKELEKGKGLGLNNIVSRIKLLKGAIEVSSEKGGTMYMVEIPL